MKKNLLILLLAAVVNQSPLCAQAPDWLWAKSSGGNSYEYGFSCATDASGNIIVTGTFQSPTITFGTTVLTNAGGSDFFIVKYDPNGNVLWAQSAGGWSYDGGYSCTTDASGNIIATGDFNSDSIVFGTFVLHGTVSPDVFIVKFDPNGNALWAKSAGAASWTDTGSGCSTDSSGNVIVTGQFQSPTITFDTIVVSSTNSPDIFIVKYSPNGNALWAKSAGGSAFDEPFSCSTDPSGNIFATGDFASPTLIFDTTTLTNVGSKDMFIVKYDANGNVLWAKSAGGTADETGNSCSTDASGNVIATGSFYGSTVTFGTTVLTNAGFAEIFIVKYDANGNVLWAKSATGGTSYGAGCITDAGGNIIATGSFFSPTITFDTTVINNTDVSGNTGDIFIVKYDTSGNVLWVKSAGGAGNFADAPYGCITDNSGNIFTTGSFDSPTISFGTSTLNNAGNNDMFVAKLASTDVSTKENDLQEAITIFPNPAINHFTLEMPGNQKVEVIITDITGKTIYSATAIKTRRIELNADGFAHGLYFVRFQTEDFTETKKLIVTK